MILTYKPLDRWDGDLTEHRKDPQFRSDWSATMRLLGDEVDRLAYPPHGDHHAYATIRLAVDPRWIRKDGNGLIQGAVFDHPGVVLTFDDSEGRELAFRCDRYERRWGSRQAWRDNAHAIALTLKSLRDLNRWGVVDNGQQYQGFRAALGSGIVVGPQDESMTPAEAAAYIAEASEQYHSADQIAGALPLAEEAYRVAAHLHHPDKPTGNSIVFAKANTAIAVLRKAAGR